MLVLKLIFLGEMQRLGLSQNLQQKLSPQQIQFIKLLQVPTAELENRIEEELEINPALEEGSEEERVEQEEKEDNGDNESEADTPSDDAETPETTEKESEVDIKDYLQDDDYGGYKSQSDGDEEERDMPLATSSSLHESLTTQLGFLGLGDLQYAIGKQLVNNLSQPPCCRSSRLLE